MGRLIVEACTAEWVGGDVYYTLLTGVSVSRADTGASVTGLESANFRVASFIGSVKDFKVGAVYERKWEPNDVTLSGVYQVEIRLEPADSFTEGNRYIFGIQARTFNPAGGVIDQGQAILELISMGE